jgi:hypothetical protein
LRSKKLEFFTKGEVATVAEAWDNIFVRVEFGIENCGIDIAIGHDF